MNVFTREYWEIAQRVCTPAELEAVELERHGNSQWQIARTLGISRSAARERLRNAKRKIDARADQESIDIGGDGPAARDAVRARFVAGGRGP